MPTEYRHEYKYLCTAEQLFLLNARLKGLLKPDPHAGAGGSYFIRSLYFDTPENTCFYENENGTDPRSKYRIRIYNSSDQRILLERKSKRRGMTHKDACPISRCLCEKMLAGELPPPTAGQPPLLREMLAELRTKHMRPAVIVQYERRPYICPVGNVRITLDTRISASRSFRHFFSPHIPARQILANGQGILEVKWDQLLPSHIKNQLSLEGLSQTAFSKYYLCRKYIGGGMNP